MKNSELIMSLLGEKKINRANPAEIFETEETSRFDIAWPEEVKEDIKEEVKEEQMLNEIRSK